MASRGRQILIGCGLGCTALILIVVVSIVSFFSWLNRRGELLDPQQLLGAETTGYVEWTLRLEDPGTRRLVESLIELSRSARARSTHDDSSFAAALQTWLRQLDRRPSEKDLQALFPMVVTWSIRAADDPQKDLHLLAFSLESLGNRLVFGDWLLRFFARRSDDLEVVSYGAETIYVHRDLAFFLRQNGVYFASDPQTARHAVDRMERPSAAGPGAGAVEPLLATLPRERILRGAITNRRGELARIWTALCDLAETEITLTLPWEQVESLTLEGGFTDDSGLQLQVRLTGADAEWAAEQGPAITAALRSLLEALEFPGQLDGTSDGPLLRLDLRIEDLPALLQHLEQRIDEDREPPA